MDCPPSFLTFFVGEEIPSLPWTLPLQFSPSPSAKHSRNRNGELRSASLGGSGCKRVTYSDSTFDLVSEAFWYGLGKSYLSGLGA